MSIKSDKWIEKMSDEHDMISPFTPKQVKSDKISYWVSSYGYDIRVSDEYKIFTNVNNSIVDPKNFDENSFSGSDIDIDIDLLAYCHDLICDSLPYQLEANTFNDLYVSGRS